MTNLFKNFYNETRELKLSRRVHLEGNCKEAIEVGRNRLLVTGIVMMLAFAAVTGRVIDLTMLDFKASPRYASAPSAQLSASRADIVDRNGVVLATNLPADSLFANPREILDAKAAIKKIRQILPRSILRIWQRN